MEFRVVDWKDITFDEINKADIKEIDYDKKLVVLYDNDILDKVSDITWSKYTHNDYDVALQELLDCYNELKEEADSLQERYEDRYYEYEYEYGD